MHPIREGGLEFLRKREKYISAPRNFGPIGWHGVNGKADDNQVLTNVPPGAVFTDTVYTHPATHNIAEVSGLQAALNGKVDDSQVLTNVPANAAFTDTPLDMWHSASSQYIPTTKLYFENSSLTLDAAPGSPTLGAWFVRSLPSISHVSDLQSALNDKVEVLTNRLKERA